MRRPNLPPAASLAYAAASTLRHLPALTRRTWWTPETIEMLRAAERDAMELDDLGMAIACGHGCCGHVVCGPRCACH